MCLWHLSYITTNRDIGWVEQSSNVFQPIRQDSSSAGTVTGLTGWLETWPAYLFLYINFKAMAFHLFCNILQPFCVFPTGLILSFTSRRVKNRICVSLMLLAAILPSLNPRRLITSVSRGGVGEKWRQRKVVKSCQNSSASPPSPCSGKLGSTCFVSQSAQVRPASTIYLSAIPDLIIYVYFVSRIRYSQATGKYARSQYHSSHTLLFFPGYRFSRAQVEEYAIWYATLIFVFSSSFA